jgi:hypothetical protein
MLSEASGPSCGYQACTHARRECARPYPAAAADPTWVCGQLPSGVCLISSHIFRDYPDRLALRCPLRCPSVVGARRVPARATPLLGRSRGVRLYARRHAP